LRNGFGAMILSDIEHLPIEEIHAAIDAAPDLLSPRGVLVISELDSFHDGAQSVFGLMDRAKKSFGHGPETIGLMRLQNSPVPNRSGRQVTFRK